MLSPRSVIHMCDRKCTENVRRHGHEKTRILRHGWKSPQSERPYKQNTTKTTTISSNLILDCSSPSTGFPATPLTPFPQNFWAKTIIPTQNSSLFLLSFQIFCSNPIAKSRCTEAVLSQPQRDGFQVQNHHIQQLMTDFVRIFHRLFLELLLPPMRRRFTAVRFRCIYTRRSNMIIMNNGTIVNELGIDVEMATPSTVYS
jgi:hypothetical protein